MPKLENSRTLSPSRLDGRGQAVVVQQAHVPLHRGKVAPAPEAVRRLPERGSSRGQLIDGFSGHRCCNLRSFEAQLRDRERAVVPAQIVPIFSAHPARDRWIRLEPPRDRRSFDDFKRPLVFA